MMHMHIYYKALSRSGANSCSVSSETTNLETLYQSFG